MDSCRTVSGLIATAMVLGFLGTGVAMAQSRTDGSPISPAPRSGQPAPQADETQPKPNQPPGTLSHDLDRSDGVIQPPENIDPGMSRPVPPEDAAPRMPVIPPPGTAGGDPSVTPK